MTIGTNGPDILTGGAGSDLLEGLAGDDRLDGAGGVDETRGGLGDDFHFVDHSSDLVVEAAGEGVDTVYARATFVLGANVEHLVLRGSDPINGTGNSLANTITGNSAANILNGGTGADKLKGGAGNDTYYVDNASDQVVEASGGGIDLVYSTVSFVLSGEAENLTLTGTGAINGTGNAHANTLVGNSAANKINGGAGADEMRGGAGDDSYVVDNVADLVVEGSGNGTDLVTSSISYTLGAYQENLTLTGLSALNGTGNGLANILVGNKGANVLNGGGAADVMRGADGNDTYIVDHIGDAVVEGSNRGTDTVQSSVDFVLGAYVENLTLGGAGAIDGTGNGLANIITGNAAANVLGGGAGDDVLNGGSGSDQLVGGSGSDLFEFTAALGGGNIDLVDDFSVVNDTIRLGGTTGQAFVLLASGALGADAFRIGSGAADADDRIVYNSASGALLYDADGVGGAAAVQFATLDPGLALTAADFVVAGPANHLPTISSNSTASVQENIPTSTIVYQTVASDSDSDSIAYTLGGADASRFTIDKNGAVRFVSSPDFEADSSYSITVRAEDSSGNGASKAVTVTVTDVNETVSAYHVNETAAANGSTGTAQSLNRNLFTAVDNPNALNDSLPTAIISGTVSSSTDTDYFSVTLQEGELLLLDVDNSGGNLDAKLWFYDSGGDLLKDNDDPGYFDTGSNPHPEYGHNTDSVIRFRAPADGIYYFAIESFQDPANPTLGSYELNVSIGPSISPDEVIKWNLNETNIEAMLSGASWADPDLTYGFTRDEFDYAGDEGDAQLAAGMTPLNATQRTAVNTIVAQYANLTDLTFTLLSTNPGNAQLRYALSNEPETASAYPPGVGDGGDSWYNTTEYTNPAVGNYEWMTFIHETGHALGLKHGHEDPALTSDRDSLEFSVMTYRSHIGAPVDEGSGYTNETWGFPQTLMMYDIAALQRMYGADFTFNSGDTTYSWNTSTGAFMINGTVQWTPGANRVFMTLWDGGGEDTYDLSNYSGSTIIDLRPGEWTKTSAFQLANLGDEMARGNVANALLYNNDPRSLIENVIGGSDNDTIIANAAVNELTGNGGQNQFRWTSVSDSPPGAADTITDYHLDIINLVEIDAIAATPGDDAFTLIHSDAFSGTAGEFRWEVTGDVIDFFADVDGDMVADLHIVALWDDGSEPWMPDHLFML